jgi:hypothetical protein
VFSGIAAMTSFSVYRFSGLTAYHLRFVENGVLEDVIFISIQFRKGNDAINALFTIISAIGFATTIGSCFFLNKESTLRNDLW